MKYMIMIYSNPANWEHPLFLQPNETLSEKERDERVRKFTALLEEIGDSGELVDSAPLADPLTTKTIRTQDEELVISDGPFLDSKEHLAGYFVVDCESIERATEIASRFPDVADGAVEVRPIMDLGGREM